MAKCRQPGCPGQTAYGKCTTCGALENPAAWTPPGEDEPNTGWFRDPDVLTGSRSSPPKPKADNDETHKIKPVPQPGQPAAQPELQEPLGRHASPAQATHDQASRGSQPASQPAPQPGRPAPSQPAPDQAAPSQSAQGQAGQSQSGQGQGVQSQAGWHQGVQGQTELNQGALNQAALNQASQGQAAQTRAAQSQAAQSQAAQNQTAQNQTAQSQGGLNQGTQGQAGGNQGMQGQTAPSQAAQNQAAQNQAASSQAAQNQFAQGQAAQNQPAQGQPRQPAPGQPAPSPSAPGQSVSGQSVPGQPGQPGQQVPRPSQGPQPMPGAAVAQGSRGPQSMPMPAPQPGQPAQNPQPMTPARGVPAPQGQPSQGFQPGQPSQGVRPAPGEWRQDMSVPAVQPRHLDAPDFDAPQPTSVLASVEPTQSIAPPKPVVAEASSTTGAKPTSDSAPFPAPGHGTGSRRTASRVRGRGLGAGLVEVPPVPYRDPASAIMPDPMVAENKRFCSNCGSAVGRGTNGEPGSPDGECQKCGTPFSFRPKLGRGDILGGQYEVLGCLAYGGLGWIYLAKDRNVSDRWVVLKGLINTGDQTAMAAAVAEQRFLAEVEHANIVKIYNFVQHPDPQTGTAVGYIVMEYIGGQSLRQIALEHHRTIGRAEPLPIGQVIAYGLEILPAVGYLHSRGLLYCDLKPDNVIQTDSTLKLIDLGAVRREDDYESPLFFTLGYSAPELAERGASVASDIYTVGRTLAVLSIEFTGYTGKYRNSLPSPDEALLFKLFDSYYRVLRRATHPDPERRFESAEDMAEQLTGVLREVMALGTNRPRPGLSTMFGPEPRTFGTTVQTDERGVSLTVPDPSEVIGALPVPQVDTEDPGAGILAAVVAGDLNELVGALAQAPQNSVEVRLRMLRARTEVGDIARASGELEMARRLAGDPHDWRLAWHRGLLELAMRRPAEARTAFDAVYDALPGEAAPKLALAICSEYMRDYHGAARFYEQVWRTDRSYVSAAFGLVRVYLAQGARTGAIEVLESVPDSSSHYVTAQVAAIKIKARAHEVTKLAELDLYDAARRLERLALDAERRTQLSVEVLEAAYGWVRAGRPGGGPGGGQVLGYDLSERELRFGLERCYRALARLAGTPEQRHELVDRANAIRPRTLT